MDEVGMDELEAMLDDDILCAFNEGVKPAPQTSDKEDHGLEVRCAFDESDDDLEILAALLEKDPINIENATTSQPFVSNDVKKISASRTDSKSKPTKKEPVKKNPDSDDECDEFVASLEGRNVNKNANKNATADKNRVRMNDKNVTRRGGKNKGDNKENQSDKMMDSDDSDWEGLDGEKSQFSDVGRDMKRLLNSATDTDEKSYTSQYIPINRKPNTLWNKQPSSSVGPQSTPSKAGKFKPSSARPTNKTPRPINAEDDPVVDPFSGIRILNPLVSSTVMEQRMQSRKMVRLSRLPTRANTSDIEGDWVTMGVIVHKSDTRKSANGNTYSIWKLSDLETQDTVSFFLFNQTYKQHWKRCVGTVIGLLNANIMKNMEHNAKFKENLSITIDHPDQLLVIGQSKDFGWCKGTTKAGNKCTQFLNKRTGEFCLYHVQAAYKKSCTKRTDVQSGFSGVTPKSYMKKIIPTGSCVFYQGTTYTNASVKSAKANVNLAKLQQHSTPGSKLTTLKMYNLDSSDQEKLKRVADAKDKPFLDMLSTPTVGSMNLVKHMTKTDTPNNKDPSNKSNTPIISVTAKDLIKQHKIEMANRKRARTDEKIITDNKNISSDSAVKSNNHVKHKKVTDADTRLRNNHDLSGDNSSSNHNSRNNNDCVKSGVSNYKNSSNYDKDGVKNSHKNADKGPFFYSDIKTNFSDSNLTENHPKTPTNENSLFKFSANNVNFNGTPVLGRGASPGGEICLDFSPMSSSKIGDKEMFSKELAKKLAIAKIKAQGGLKKADNGARKCLLSDKAQKRIAQRVKSNIHTQSLSSSDTGESDNPKEPPRKKSRYLGNLDLKSEDVQKLLKAKSTHRGAVQELENERKERYFDGLEKKEMYEEKMASIKEVKCKVFSCGQCGYDAVFGPSDLCKRENHTITCRQAVKKFFECRNCKHRTVSIFTLPTAPCINCGEHSYVRTSMMKEKKAPQLESEKLLLRGEEEKFLNSLK